MKKILSLSLPFAIIILFLTSCNNKERKAKILIKEYLKTTMNDYSSYEPMEFSKLDTVYSSYYKDSIYINLQKLQSNNSDYIKHLEETIKEADKFNGRIGRILDRRGIASEPYLKAANIENDRLTKEMRKLRKNFKSEMDGFSMVHKMRAKNTMGGIMIYETIFFFNKELTKVTGEMNAEEYNDFESKLKILQSQMDELGI